MEFRRGFRSPGAIKTDDCELLMWLLGRHFEASARVDVLLTPDLSQGLVLL